MMDEETFTKEYFQLLICVTVMGFALLLLATYVLNPIMSLAGNIAYEYLIIGYTGENNTLAIENYVAMKGMLLLMGCAVFSIIIFLSSYEWNKAKRWHTARGATSHKKNGRWTRWDTAQTVNMKQRISRQCLLL